jgi:hypothetical protein
MIVCDGLGFVDFHDRPHLTFAQVSVGESRVRATIAKSFMGFPPYGYRIYRALTPQVADRSPKALS